MANYRVEIYLEDGIAINVKEFVGWKKSHICNWIFTHSYPWVEAGIKLSLVVYRNGKKLSDNELKRCGFTISSIVGFR